MYVHRDEVVYLLNASLLFLFWIENLSLNLSYIII